MPHVDVSATVIVPYILRGKENTSDNNTPKLY